MASSENAGQPLTSCPQHQIRVRLRPDLANKASARALALFVNRFWIHIDRLQYPYRSGDPWFHEAGQGHGRQHLDLNLLIDGRAIFADFGQAMAINEGDRVRVAEIPKLNGLKAPVYHNLTTGIHGYGGVDAHS
ncbi:hypothetical protein VSX64_21995 [Aurantimonas sp. C2-6-R+9]|uniref:hypothetical protein n=1 Tax=unclassified Aurantimonas TaxID=2638230 RepID=UPI002E174BA4|nr:MULTISPECIES: hypothetical protein [unclassified Aurantimonas]MEC5293140.1 hypothetical protein [Aurantimonas sp. C2-3-R2]MEC5383458.1 hypothetical protein [Aurantimonas sp. C2-6-R+9]